MIRADVDSPSKRRADIQGLRALAVLLVVAFHANVPLHGGFIGVDVFFVISGFVITRLLRRDLESAGTLNLVGFYTRRIRRLLPALTLLLVVTAASSVFFLSPFGAVRATAATGTGAALFAANLQLFFSPTGYFDPDTSANALTHTWSLSVEEQFYAVFPVFLLLIWRFGSSLKGRWTSRRIALWALVAGGSISFIAACGMSYGHGDRLAHALGGGVTRAAFYLPITRAWEFACGGVVALVAWQTARTWSSTLASSIGILTIVAGAVCIDVDTPFPGWVALFPTIGTALLLFGGARGPIAKFFSTPFLVWIGDRSYGWYLWHWPLVVFARAIRPDLWWLPIITAIASLGPASLSYRYLEEPLRRNDSLRGWKTIGLLAGCIMLAVGSWYAAGVRSAAAVRQPSATSIATALAPHADLVRGCTDATPFTLACMWPVSPSRGSVVLVGDSNAGHFTEPVASAANAAGYSFHVTTRPACPFADVVLPVRGRDSNACHRYVESTLAALEVMRPSLVIIARASTTYVRGASSLAAWESGTRSMVARLSKANIPVLLVHAVPVVDDYNLATCPAIAISSGGTACERTAPRASIEAQQQAVRGAEQRALVGIPEATTVDFTDDLCSAELCTTRRDGVWIYRDSGHLSVPGALQLTPRVSRLIADLARPTP